MDIFGQINAAVFDWPWSGIHWLSGFVIGVLLILFLKIIKPGRFWSLGFGLLLLWELVEITLRYLDVHAHEAIAPLKQTVGGFAFAPESTANIVGDLAIGSLGLVLGRRLSGLLPPRKNDRTMNEMG